MGSVESDASAVVDSLFHPARFAVLYDRHLERVAVYLTRRVGSDLAEDLTAEVFARAFRARGTFRREHESALPWLLGIASHLVGDHRRAERRRLTGLKRLLTATPAAVNEDVAVLAPDRHLERDCRLRRSSVTPCSSWCGGSCPTRGNRSLANLSNRRGKTIASTAAGAAVAPR